MKVYIEILIILIATFIFIGWIIWYKWSERRLIKKYKPENDKGRTGKTIRRTERGTKNAIGNLDGFKQLEGQECLQETDTNSTRTNSNSHRKIRRILRRG